MCRPLDLMEFHLNNGQTSAVRIRHGLGGDTVGLPKSARMYKGCTRDVQGMYKGCTRDVQGMYKGCTRDVQGMYKGCTRDVQGMYNGCTRDVQGIPKGYPRDTQGTMSVPPPSQHCRNTVASRSRQALRTSPHSRMRYRVRVNIVRHMNSDCSTIEPGQPRSSGENIIHCNHRAQASRRAKARSQAAATFCCAWLH